MEKIYIDFKDENVAKYVLYADDTYLYLDANKTKKASAEEVVDTFIKGVFVDVDGIKYIPVSIAHTDAIDPAIAYETVTCVKADSTTATTPVLFTVRSTD